jgi:hypothetical protein
MPETEFLKKVRNAGAETAARSSHG